MWKYFDKRLKIETFSINKSETELTIFTVTQIILCSINVGKTKIVFEQITRTKE